MKIALYHNLTSGGSKREAYELTRYLVQQGHIVDLFCPSTANERFLPLQGIVREQRIFPLQLLPPLNTRLPGLRKYVDLLNLLRNFRRLRQVARQMARAIDAGDYDFVFAHHDQIVQSPYLLGELRTPAVYYCAEPMRACYEPAILRPDDVKTDRASRLQETWYRPAQTLAHNLICAQDRRNVAHADLLLTNSFFSAEAIYRAYGQRARVVYLGVDVEKFRSLSLERRNFVLSVGAVSPLKGYDFLLQALGCLPVSERPDLLIVGNTVSLGEQRFLEKLAQEQGVSLEIRCNVSEAELVELYNTAIAFVYAPVLEPFGLTPLEAMACGTPVVAVKEGGVRESVIDGETGLLVERVPDLFAAALQQLLADRPMREVFGQTGRQRVLDFWTWDHAGERFWRVLQESGLV